MVAIDLHRLHTGEFTYENKGGITRKKRGKNYLPRQRKT